MTHTLLLADDSPTIHRVIELTFADEDISVVAVDDGDKAIASIDRLPPDIVLADIGMPGRSGYEVARHVKETPALAHIPVLLLTGAFEPVDPAVVTAMGCDGVLTKPFEPQAVVRRVKELLEGKRKSAPQPSSSAMPQMEMRNAAAEVAAGVEAEPAVVPPPDIVRAPVIEPPHVQAEALAVAPTPFPGPRAVPPPVVDGPLVPSVETVRVARPADALPPVVPPRSDADVESYFEELDQAFATLANPEREPLPSFDRLRAEPVARPMPTPSSTPTLTSHPTPIALADAFTALLAAERTDPGPAGPRVRPVATPVSAVSSEELVERVARRALEGLSEGAIREMVERMVSATAERLIREEIERIKSNIK